MRVWVDADACPRPIKEVLFRAADRREVTTTLVANQYLKTPPSKYVSAVQVPQGFDVADNEIVRRMEDGRIPKDLLYGELAAGTRSLGRPKLRFPLV